jgi:hypothetical protein
MRRSPIDAARLPNWFNHAQFLRKERYIFACLLLAEITRRTTPGDEIATVSQARKESDARLGKRARCPK